MPDTSVARRGRTVRRVAAALAVVGTAAAATACGSSAHTRTVTDTGGAGVTTTRTMTTTSSTSTTPAAPAGPAAPGRLTASPATGSPSSTVTFSFTPRSLAYAGRQIAVSYGLSIHGPVRSGCVGEHAGGIAVTQLGLKSVTVGPAQLGGRWCTGTYTARVEAIARPVCAQGTMCPQFIRIVASFGPATFRITAAG